MIGLTDGAREKLTDLLSGVMERVQVRTNTDDNYICSFVSGRESYLLAVRYDPKSYSILSVTILRERSSSASPSATT